jgi:hypothetical protein
MWPHVPLLAFLAPTNLPISVRRRLRARLEPWTNG